MANWIGSILSCRAGWLGCVWGCMSPPAPAIPVSRVGSSAIAHQLLARPVLGELLIDARLEDESGGAREEREWRLCARGESSGLQAIQLGEDEADAVPVLIVWVSPSDLVARPRVGRPQEAGHLLWERIHAHPAPNAHPRIAQVLDHPVGGGWPSR